MGTLKNIFIADAVSNCIPVWSTLTNGCQLLYKLIHKVDATAIPVIAPKAKLSTDLKIYILSKGQLRNWLSAIAMIPILGNIVSLIINIGIYCRGENPDGFLLHNCYSSIGYQENSAQKRELFRLALENRHLDHEDVIKHPNFLLQASRQLDRVQFKQLLNYPFPNNQSWPAAKLTLILDQTRSTFTREAIIQYLKDNKIGEKGWDDEANGHMIKHIVEVLVSDTDATYIK